MIGHGDIGRVSELTGGGRTWVGEAGDPRLLARLSNPLQCTLFDRQAGTVAVCHLPRRCDAHNAKQCQI
jgi:hypothetical protein